MAPILARVYAPARGQTHSTGGMMRTFVAIALLITNVMSASAQNVSSAQNGSPSNSWRLAQRHCCCYRGDRAYADGQGVGGCDNHRPYYMSCVCQERPVGLATCSWNSRFVPGRC